MQPALVTDEQSAKEALREVVVGDEVRITFRADVGGKFQQATFLNLQHRIRFDTMWLVVAHNTLAVYGKWNDVPRAQNFTITRMGAADREYFAHILAELAESIEIL